MTKGGKRKRKKNIKTKQNKRTLSNNSKQMKHVEGQSRINNNLKNNKITSPIFLKLKLCNFHL